MISGAKIQEELLLFGLIGVIVTIISIRGCEQSTRLEAQRLRADELRTVIQANSVFAVPPEKVFWSAAEIEAAKKEITLVSASQPVAKPAVPVVAQTLSQPGLLGESAGLLLPSSAGGAPRPADMLPPASSSHGRPRIDLNAATIEQLMELDGIGEARAGDIIAYRLAIGGFSSIDQLTEVSGIGPKILAKIRKDLTLGNRGAANVPNGGAHVVPVSSGRPAPISPSAARAAPSGVVSGKVNINTAGVEQLMRLSGVGEKRARDIIVDRQRNGPFRTPADIMRIRGIGEKTYRKNAHLITVR